MPHASDGLLPGRTSMVEVRRLCSKWASRGIGWVYAFLANHRSSREG
jgi:hypothetical protein